MSAVPKMGPRQKDAGVKSQLQVWKVWNKTSMSPERPLVIVLHAYLPRTPSGNFGGFPAVVHHL